MLKLGVIVLAGWHGLNGMFMLLFAERWYETVPGVTHTGPYNGHFIADIGIAFLASAIGLALAVRMRGIAAAALLVSPAVFLGGHALLHLTEFFHGHLSAAEIVRDTLVILVPGFAPAWLAWHYIETARNGEL